ncbi:hypothetical protein TVAG_456560 [Trichomonas vaginalis G3]|uniref:Importin N-terminal domain-containing protein n=1 Tax=Trichomonas vaginalis (strain ATCC PRA-98 / G3) TaxID=412133 RepID=A2DBY0_TRIV3|nr:armadillo (ARM) repeat-containing protein family [Trichomonas vaginalis G3]EAY22021.1 hypothetical protein TVAG_456560 [Trichomonas vaginalis G3]KAI5525354.1 armadillo (ARM) repeat-containing protein family [Trichomonas vaginalis G3]|eukprot:XP_001583007.1 hypothetical protein [Trichomonas vaginalis G3]
MDFDEFFQVFKNSISNDERIGNASESAINIFAQQNPSNFIIYLYRILITQEVEENYRLFALINLKNLITPSYSHNISSILEALNQIQPANQKNDIFEIFMYYSQIECKLQSLACHSTALYFRFDIENYTNTIINRINEMTSASEQDINVLVGIGNIFVELFLNLTTMELRKFIRYAKTEIVAQIYNLFISILSNIEIDEKIREIYLECIYQFFLKLELKQFTTDTNPVLTFFELLPKILPYTQEKSFSICHTILLLIIRKYYANIGEGFQQIYYIGNCGLQMENLSFKCIAIDFWSDVAKINKQIINATKNSQNLILNNAENIVPILVECLSISENPSEEEYDACKKATKALKNISIILPKQILDNYGNDICNWLQSNDKKAIYKALLLLHAFVSSKKTIIFSEFVISQLQYILNRFGDENVMIKKLAIVVMSKIVKVFQNDLRNEDNIVSIALEFVKSVDDPQNLTYGLHFLCPVLEITNEVFLNNIYEDVYSFLLEIMTNESISNEGNLLFEAFNAFDILIQRKCEHFRELNIKTIETLLNLIETTLTSFQNSVDSVPFPDRKLQLACLSVSILLDNTPSSLLDYEAIVNQLFNIYNNFDLPIRVDLFLVIESVIKNDKDNIFLQFGDAFVMFIENALNSQIPDLIGTAAEAFGSYMYAYRANAICYGQTLEHILYILQNDATPQYPVVYSRLISCVGLVLTGVREQMPDNVFSQIIEILTSFMNTKVEENEKENYIEVIPSILQTLKRLFATSEENHDQQFIRWTKKNVFSTFISQIWENKIFNDQILSLILDLLETIGNVLKGNISVSLRTPTIKYLVEEALFSFDENLSEKSEKFRVLLDKL